MSEDMDTKGIYFDLQWKTKSGNAVEFASIGIWEVDDTSLDWFTFKPYLCQALGNLGNISISYVDSDGDEIPIDSDLEFQEALKFARRKAAFQQKIVLKVEKQDDQAAASSGGMELLNNPIYLKSSSFFKERLRINSSGEDHDAPHASFGEEPIRVSSPSCKVKTKPKAKDIFCPLQSCDSPHASSGEEPIRVSGASCKVKTKPKAKDIFCPLQSCDSPPLWFKKYMKKMKSEIISEVTANVNTQMKKILLEVGQKTQPVIFPSTSVTSNPGLCCESNAWIVTKTKKKTSDGESSSDGAPKFEIRDSKILRKIEKLDRRERKLDHKKEKLEQKTRKIAERKERECLSRLRLELAGCKGSRMDRGHFNKLREPEVVSVPKKKVSVSEPIQNPVPAAPLGNAPVGVTLNNDDMHMMTVKRNSNFTKVWKVTNSGGVKWTDETEVKLSWGNAGLTPEVSSMKCPPLAPGEEGEIAISYTSPMFPGVFESHWHFYHNNVRFGGRLSCVVSVDLIQRDEEPNGSPRSQSCLSPSSSAEFVVVHPTSVGDDGSYGVTGNKDSEIDLGVIPEVAPSESANNDEPSEKAEGFSLASGPWMKDEKLSAEDKCSCSGVKDEELNSLTTDGFSGSDHSLGSDSDENFVVVPMPPCFRIDIPLTSADAGAPEINAVQKEECVAESKAPPAKEAPESPEHMPSAPPLLDPLHASEASNAQAPGFAHFSGVPLQREVSHDTGEVISVPLIPPQPKPSASPFQPAVTPPKRKNPEPRVIIVNKQSPLSSPVATQRAASPAKSSGDRSPASDHTYASSSSSEKFESSSSLENKRRSERDRGTERPANIPRPESNPRSSPSSSRPIDLRPPQIVSEVTPGTVYRESPDNGRQRSRRVNHEDPPPPPIDAIMANSLRKLANMGFVDLELNQALLRVYNHDLTQVIEALLNGKP
ncbi:next to BRCA1 gene 1 protein-like isoform X2 [Ischnura elegans]|uniref:next to BRCA1 gene 1 protein-like isoform X2 n=1 Tax=Ischnura elegans TaxID=197161 RepID=UPI001ED87E57|nr:next to BRCA1 gene 1 protein-like isoform X2 [Ischnura elegans]